MNADEALKFVEQLLSERGKRLNDLQRMMFKGAWDGRSSKEIHQDSPHRCSYEHLIQNVGPELWKLLSEVVGDRVSKRNLQGPIERAKDQRSIPDHSGTTATLLQPSVKDETELAPYPLQEEFTPRRDWSVMPAVSSIFGRLRELQQLEERVIFAGARLIVLYGVPGIGKTTLAVKLVHQVKDQFEYLIWRSLQHPPTIQALIADLTQFLSDGAEASTDVSRLLHYLQSRRCLIVLDGLEAVLRGGVHNGSYREGYEGYRELLRHIGQMSHLSCVVLTSWEQPKEVASMEDEHRVFALKLDGLGELATRDFLAARGANCTETDSRAIIHRYEGNPFALNAIATNVRGVFNGDIQTFLQQGPIIFDDIRVLLERQFDRLSDLERAIVECLVTYHEPLTIAEIIQAVTLPISYAEVVEVLQSLLRRALIEGSAARYSLQVLMAAYIMNRQCHQDV